MSDGHRNDAPGSFSLPVLHRRFEELDRYAPAEGAWKPLPFRFTSLDEHRYVASNLSGEYLVLPRRTIEAVVNGTLLRSDPHYLDLISHHFIVEGNSNVAIDLLAAKYRTKLAHLADFTGLHIFVVTLRCDHSCPYCQVSRVSSDRESFDMSRQTADSAIDLMFQSPNPVLKVEFQGGESLLNFDLIRYIVESVETRSQNDPREIQFVIATNLAPLTQQILEYCREHEIFISTSLDGPADIHNANRPRPGANSYELAIQGIDTCRRMLGEDGVSALMTTTRRSLACPERIIDEYIDRGFESIFLRWMSPYGFARKTEHALGYPADEWNGFYERGLRYILDRNLSGTAFREDYASIILRKMLTPYATGYVDLQSPSGLGISVVVYNYDGDVYASDESRMLAESGDTSFRLGNVQTDTYEDIFGSGRLRDLLESTMVETVPGCTDCAFQMWCGTDPTLHHAMQGDMVGLRPTSPFCNRNMAVFRLLVRIMGDEPEYQEILRSWAQC